MFVRQSQFTDEHELYAIKRLL